MHVLTLEDNIVPHFSPGHRICRKKVICRGDALHTPRQITNHSEVSGFYPPRPTPLSELYLVSAAPIIDNEEVPDAHPTDFSGKVVLPNGGNLRLLEEARATLIAFGFWLPAFSF